MTLEELKTGESAVIDVVGGEGELRQHFLDMGVIPGAEVTLIKLAPMGDPMELRIHGYELTLRLADAAKIQIHRVKASRQLQADVQKNNGKSGNSSKKEHPGYKAHPGYGELGEHKKNGRESGAVPVNDGQVLSFALAGNQNCGKTTLFNQLTGSNQHVGNFPGVTVDRKSGQIKGITPQRVSRWSRTP